MKKTILFLTAMLLQVALLHAQITSSNAVNVLSSNPNGVELRFAAPELSVQNVSFGLDTFSVLHMDGFLPTGNVGAPTLPATNYLLEIPICKRLLVDISDAVYDTLTANELGVSHLLLPGEAPLSKSERV